MGDDRFNLDELGSIEVEKEGTEFDLRESEKVMFSKLYAHLLESYMAFQREQSSENAKKFLNASKTILNSFKRYVQHDDELFDTVQETEEYVNSTNQRLHSGQVVNPGIGNIDKVKEVIEDLRHAANLKMPQKSNVSEDQAWRKST